MSNPIEQATSTSSLLYRGRTPRKDIYEKSEQTIDELLKQHSNYQTGSLFDKLGITGKLRYCAIENLSQLYRLWFLQPSS